MLSLWSERKCQSLHLTQKFKERKIYEWNEHKVKVHLVRENLFFNRQEDSIIWLTVTATAVVFRILIKIKQNWLNCFFSFKFLKEIFTHQFRSVTQSCPTLRPHGLQHARPPCPSPTPGAYSNSCPLSRWCHSTISSSVVPFSSRLQSFPASGSFQTSQFFASGGQVLQFQLQFFQWIPLGLDWLDLLAVQGTLKSLL